MTRERLESRLEVASALRLGFVEVVVVGAAVPSTAGVDGPVAAASSVFISTSSATGIFSAGLSS